MAAEHVAAQRTQARTREDGRELVIDRGWCKGCAICVALCPRQVLGMDPEGKAAVLDLARCTWCRACELRCPDLAIEILAPGGRGEE